METKNFILILIAMLIVALICVSGYVLTHGDENAKIDNETQNVTNTTGINKTNSTLSTVNDTNNNTTHRVYDPQTDSYVTVIGEGYDSEVKRWYTYDSDGVRYYNTRIK